MPPSSQNSLFSATSPHDISVFAPFCKFNESKQSEKNICHSNEIDSATVSFRLSELIK